MYYTLPYVYVYVFVFVFVHLFLIFYLLLLLLFSIYLYYLYLYLYSTLFFLMYVFSKSKKICGVVRVNYLGYVSYSSLDQAKFDLQV